jgi:hypothetical protein
MHLDYEAVRHCHQGLLSTANSPAPELVSQWRIRRGAAKDGNSGTKTSVDSPN